MKLMIENVLFYDRMKQKDLSAIIFNNSDKYESDDKSYLNLRYYRPVAIRNLDFCVAVSFRNGILEAIQLVALCEQENNAYRNFQDKKQLHEKWLQDHYGEPDRIEPYGYVYEREGGRITSEFDPRSGNNYIIFRFY